MGWFVLLADVVLLDQVDGPCGWQSGLPTCPRSSTSSGRRRIDPLHAGVDTATERRDAPVMSAELNQALALAGLGLRLLGRDRELGALYELIDGIELRGGVALVRGEAGIGKTALLEAASVRALERGSAVTRASASESESPLAFAGLHQLLKPYLALLNELRPNPAGVERLESAFGLVAGRTTRRVPHGVDSPPWSLLSSAATGAHNSGLGRGRSLARSGVGAGPDVPSDADWRERSRWSALASVRDGDAERVRQRARLPELRLSGLDDAAAGALLDLHAHELSSADLFEEARSRRGCGESASSARTSPRGQCSRRRFCFADAAAASNGPT